ncbi:MAG: DUF4336 domain-containing protein [Snowella sp.]|nr:DUF4336 domain-containing protein [Snowella sp.]
MAPADRSVLSQVTAKDWSWPFWYLVPIYPYGQKRTLRVEIVKDWVWTFEQVQGIFYVVVPIRMTVIRLETGGLLVYAPVAPTPECIRLVQELVNQYGEVKYIILPTISGLEHKVNVGPFARRFAKAQVFVAPGQWSFPVKLPLSWLGFPRDRTQVLPTDSRQAPFGDEFDYAILGPLDLRLGQFGEVAFFHRRSQTLLVTDSVISIPEKPPAILQLDPYPLLFHAKDRALDYIADNERDRLKGWQRICLFSLYFQASTLEVPNWGNVFQEAAQAPDRSKKAYFGLFPFQWKSNWPETFQQLRGNGRLLVAPILRQLILNRAPQETLAWADRVARWDFTRIIPCHFEAAIAATPTEFRQAFSFLEKPCLEAQRLPNEDLETLQKIDRLLVKFKITPSPKV